MRSSVRRVGVAAVPRRPLGTAYEDGDVAAAVRRAIRGCGYGGSTPEAPLSDVIAHSSTVLIKPNWVLHCNSSGAGLECLVTQPAVLKALVQEVAAARPSRIIVGDAPIQRAHFEDIATAELQRELQRLAGAVPVEVVDFRDVVSVHSRGVLTSRPTARTAEQGVHFDLAHSSFLEPVSKRAGRFRITSYDPAALADAHSEGRHIYRVCREALEADVVIGVPKLKSHKKAGLTGALKNWVGINADKRYLPHHRIGGSAIGGDAYPGFRPGHRVAEYCLDQANRNIGRSGYRGWMRAAGAFLKFHRGDVEGSWFGNDTVWRMVLDLNRILMYGARDGTLSAHPQRRVLCLTDAIVVGQGEGPLAPTPLWTGAITFADDCAAADVVNAALLRFHWRQIPSIAHSFDDVAYCLSPAVAERIEVWHESERVSWNELALRVGQPCRPARGWEGVLEWRGHHTQTSTFGRGHE
jgi:uncharacterized protein (DUF362 family)